MPFFFYARKHLTRTQRYFVVELLLSETQKHSADSQAMPDLLRMNTLQHKKIVKKVTYNDKKFLLCPEVFNLDRILARYGSRAPGKNFFLSSYIVLCA